MGTESLMIQSVLSNWRLTITRLNTLFDGLTEAQFNEEIAPGRNRVVYLLGHLTAVHDLSLEVLRLGPRHHPELDEVFIKNPDRGVELSASLSDLRSFWKAVNQRLEDSMALLTPEQWVGRHRNVSDEEFAKNPSRNCMSVVLNRTSHAGYHLGQIMLWHTHRD